MAWTAAHANLLGHLERGRSIPFDHLAPALLDMGVEDRVTAMAVVDELVAGGLAEVRGEGIRLSDDGAAWRRRQGRRRRDPMVVEAASTVLDDVPFPDAVPSTWAVEPANWDAAVAMVRDHQREQIRRRVEVVDGIRRGLDLGNELHDVVRRCGDRSAARRALVELGFSEWVAEHLLDLRVGQQTAQARADLDAEAAKLREELDRLSPPGREGGRRT